jgi:hypothetical protein
MGAHHFKLYLVPPGAAPTRDAEGWYAGDFLASFPIADSILQRLRQIFTRTNHWGSVEEYVSDNEWGSDLRISRSDAGTISEIAFRYAACADPLEKLQLFVHIAKDAGCSLFIFSSGTVVTADFEEVFRALRSHHSFRFLSDPEGAIVEAASKIKENEGRGRHENS